MIVFFGLVAGLVYSQRPTAFVVNLSPSGSAIGKMVNGSLVINLTWPNGFNHQQQAVLVKGGSCDQPGETKYQLTPLYDGRSSSTLAISLSKLQKLLPLNITIYDSLDTNVAEISCSELNL